MTRFNDNRRLHIFVVDVVRSGTAADTGRIRMSIRWIGRRRGEDGIWCRIECRDQDEFFNYDLFTLDLRDDGIDRLTATEYCEY